MTLRFLPLSSHLSNSASKYRIYEMSECGSLSACVRVVWMYAYICEGESERRKDQRE